MLALTFHLVVTWLVWGTTYLAIAFSLEGLPPFAIAGARFCVAGGLLLLLGRARSGVWPGWRHAVSMAPVGLWLIAVGDGAVIWAALHLPSGQVALVVALTPLFLVLCIWLREGERPGTGAWVAVIAGLAGTALVAGSGGSGMATETTPRLRALAVAASVGGAAAWAWGSALMRTRREPRSLLAATGLQLLIGGVLLCALGAALGELHRIDPALLLGRPGLAILYLIVFSCGLGFVSYGWLVRRTGPALAGSWAYVNPVVALWAGHTALGEPLGAGLWAATLAVVVAVLAAQSEERRRGARALPPGGGL